MTKHRKLTVLLVAAAAATAPTAAFAQSPTDSVYAPDQGVADVVASGTPVPTATPQSGALPETATATPKTTTKAPAVKKQTAPTTTTAPVQTATPSTEQASTGNLPFTGFEAGFVALAGLALLGGGFAMRRFSRDSA